MRRHLQFVLDLIRRRIRVHLISFIDLAAEGADVSLFHLTLKVFRDDTIKSSRLKKILLCFGQKDEMWC